MSIQIKPIIREITIVGDRFKFTFTEDFTEYAIDLIEAGCNGFDENNIYDYFAEGEFESLNYEHFLHGFMERLLQSDECPDVLYNCKCPLKYIVKKVESFKEN